MRFSHWSPKLALYYVFAFAAIGIGFFYVTVRDHIDDGRLYSSNSEIRDVVIDKQGLTLRSNTYYRVVVRGTPVYTSDDRNSHQVGDTIRVRYTTTGKVVVSQKLDKPAPTSGYVLFVLLGLYMIGLSAVCFVAYRRLKRNQQRL